MNSSNIRSIASYVTKYVTKKNAKIKCQVWHCSKRISELYPDFYTTTEFTDNFIRLNAVIKEFEVKDHIDQPFLKIKMIDLNKKDKISERYLPEEFKKYLKLALKSIENYELLSKKASSKDACYHPRI